MINFETEVNIVMHITESWPELQNDFLKEESQSSILR